MSRTGGPIESIPTYTVDVPGIKDIARLLSTPEYTGWFDCQIIPADTEVLQVIVDNLDEFPVYVSATETQLLYITYLWDEKDVISTHKMSMLEAMLDMNIPIPLSSFSRIGEHYVLFGATRRDASLDAIAIELNALAENAVDALEAMSEFLH